MSRAVALRMGRAAWRARPRAAPSASLRQRAVGRSFAARSTVETGPRQQARRAGRLSRVHSSYTMKRVSLGFTAPASEVPSVCVNVFVGIPPNIVDSPMSVSGLLNTKTQIRSVPPTLRM